MITNAFYNTALIFRENVIEDTDILFCTFYSFHNIIIKFFAQAIPWDFVPYHSNHFLPATGLSVKELYCYSKQRLFVFPPNLIEMILFKLYNLLHWASNSQKEQYKRLIYRIIFCIQKKIQIIQQISFVFCTKWTRITYCYMVWYILWVTGVSHKWVNCTVSDKGEQRSSQQPHATTVYYSKSFLQVTLMH